MTPSQVKAALNGSVAHVSQGREGNESWQLYDEVGATAVYGNGPRLAAMAIDVMDGPLVQLEGVELIARVPSQAAADIHDLARRHGVPVRLNWSGDPEVASWGVSLGASQEREPSSEGYSQRTDTVITNALFVEAGLAGDPFASDPVVQWRDVRAEQTNPGAWPVTADHGRPRWGWTPHKSVGPLWFGMNPQQVASALNENVPAVRLGHYPWPMLRRPGQT
ncbi:hypothetical protein [Streptomyces sp. NPDC051577]|uniref:hypothetical protein n=1 Tax=Streptomyces sp. NPDC051577 TaxID=3155166 RepID=UPI0034310E73